MNAFIVRSQGGFFKKYQGNKLYAETSPCVTGKEMDLHDPSFFSCITELNHSCANIWFEFLKTNFKTKRSAHNRICYIPHIIYTLSNQNKIEKQTGYIQQISLENQYFKYLCSSKVPNYF